jgi:hypothetical protein
MTGTGTGAGAAAGFLERGWVVVDLAGGSVVHEAREGLLAHLRASALPGLTRLEDYHRVVDEAEHLDVWFAAASWCWDAGVGRRIVEAELPFLRGFVGLDLHVQRYPYLRLARPGRPEDVTGIHRDTLYGASPYEVSLMVPLVDVDTESALRVVTGSHTAPADRYPATRVDSEVVTPGSARHLLGFPYAPQVLDPEVATRAEPVPLRVGQALVMALGLVHGQVVNAGSHTRVSLDVRVVNSLAPVEFARGVRSDYYEPLCASPVTAQARRHLGGPPAPPAS